MAKKGKAEPGWDKIGKMVGKKMEKEFKDTDCCKPWWGNYHKDHGDGFFGRALFAIGIIFALNSLGLLHGIAPWIIWMIGIGFALMSF